MKKLVFILGIFFALQTGLFAQDLSEDIIFNAHLLSTLNLNVVTGEIQEITFQTAADYNAGVTESGTPGGIIPGISLFTVEATEDWKVEIECDDFTMGTELIPVNNLGVYLTQSGLHNLTTDCVCAFTTPTTAKGLTLLPQLLIGPGANGNAGDIPDNSFTLHWEMGTRRNPSMNTLTMFQQMAAGDFIIGDYTSIATLTLSLN